MKSQDDCLKHPELYRDRLECSLAFGEIPVAAVAEPERPVRSFRGIAIAIAICAGACLAHIAW